MLVLTWCDAQPCSWWSRPSRRWRCRRATTSRSSASVTTQRWLRGISQTDSWRWPVVTYRSSSTATTTPIARRRCWHEPGCSEMPLATTSVATRTTTSETRASFACRSSRQPPNSPSTTVCTPNSWGRIRRNGDARQFLPSHSGVCLPTRIRRGLHFRFGNFRFCNLVWPFVAFSNKTHPLTITRSTLFVTFRREKN